MTSTLRFARTRNEVTGKGTTLLSYVCAEVSHRQFLAKGDLNMALESGSSLFCVFHQATGVLAVLIAVMSGSDDTKRDLINNKSA
jgi:hypothetical protein